VSTFKLYSWELAFILSMLEVRNSRELVMLRKISIVTALSSTLWAGILSPVGFA
ncbi:hypothetical protein FISHEDRAFT_29160, partial [Fistulina hepatica ATCC 64428]